MLKTVVAIERDGLDFRAIAIVFDVPNAQFDLISAVKNAVTAYCRTEEGRRLYEYNCSNFNWGDFFDVPNEICKRFGFSRVDDILSDVCVDWDELLVYEEELEEDYDERQDL